MRLRGSREICWPHVTRMASTFHQRTMRELVSTYVCMYFVYVYSTSYSGMEALIRSQRENIAEFEAAIAANKDEIAKVRFVKTNNPLFNLSLPLSSMKCSQLQRPNWSILHSSWRQLARGWSPRKRV